MPAESISAAVNALIAAGASIEDSERIRAVTTISSSSSCASATPAASGDRANSTGPATGTRLSTLMVSPLEPWLLRGRTLPQLRWFVTVPMAGSRSTRRRCRLASESGVWRSPLRRDLRAGQDLVRIGPAGHALQSLHPRRNARKPRLQIQATLALRVEDIAAQREVRDRGARTHEELALSEVLVDDAVRRIDAAFQKRHHGRIGRRRSERLHETIGAE